MKVADKKLALLVDESVKIEDFIYAVKNKPAIWNTATEDYGNKYTKKRAWHDIILTFIPDFYERPITDQNTICE